MTIVLHPALAARQRRERAKIVGTLGLTMSGFEVFAALIQEFGNGKAPDWLDRFAVEQFGGTWGEVSAAFAEMVDRWGEEGLR